MTIRGVRRHGSLMVTSALRGIFRQNPASRSEILGLIHNGGSGH
jgi:GTP cyclohydrolase I